MQRRFTIIQGGLTDRLAGAGPAAAWRVALRRPLEIAPTEGAAWRILVDRQGRTDPFADPEYLLAGARNGARGADVAFAFAYGIATNGTETLRAVLPLVLPHAVWGGSAIRSWHPPLATRPVEPVLDAGHESAAVAAILRHLGTARPAASLRLGGLEAEGRLAGALGGAAALNVTAHPQGRIPAARFVDVSRSAEADRTERVVASRAMRDAVERFLALDAERARRPLIAEPGDASTVRVVTRLFAKRNAACVELGYRDGALVSGTIELGRGEDAVLWRMVGRSRTAQPHTPRTDLDVTLCEASETSPPRSLSLVAP